jgi:hypothetical protein
MGSFRPEGYDGLQRCFRSHAFRRHFSDRLSARTREITFLTSVAAPLRYYRTCYPSNTLDGSQRKICKGCSSKIWRCRKVQYSPFRATAAQTIDEVNLVIVSAVLHHLDDAEATELFQNLRGVFEGTQPHRDDGLRLH